MAILMVMKYCLTLVLICIPLISDVNHHFIYLSAIYLYVFFGKLSIQVLCLIFFFFNLTTPGLSCSTWDLFQLWHVGSSSLNRDRTQACGIQFPKQGSNPGPLQRTEAWPLDHQEVSAFFLINWVIWLFAIEL